MGDGSIFRWGGNTFLRLQAKDRQFVELFAVTCKRLLKRKSLSVRQTARGLYDARIASKSLCEFLEIGLWGLSPFIERYPSAFIRGLADSDGSALVTTTKMRGKPWFFVQVVVATTPDLRLLTFVKRILWKHFNIFATLVFKGNPRTRVGKDQIFKSRKKVFDLRISRFEHVRRFSQKIRFGLKRKQRKLESAIGVREQFGCRELAVRQWLSGWMIVRREWTPTLTRSKGRAISGCGGT